MMISGLPKDLVEEILSRVPLKSMRAVRLTCKKWDTLSKSRSFTKLQISKLAAESLTIVMMDYNLYLVNVVVNENLSREFKGKLTCDSKQVEISQVFHCDGLLLCILRDYIFRVVVWNPYLGQTTSIKLRYYIQDYWGRNGYRYALGYENNKNKTSRSYKILRFIDDYLGNYSINYHSGPQFLWYEIYDFDSGLWKTLDVTSPHWFIAVDQIGVTLKGNTYWFAGEGDSRERVKDYIICFDFTTERFGPLMPLPFEAHSAEFVSLSCVREEKLVVLFHDKYHSKFEIWITTKIETVKVWWSKFLTVDIGPVVIDFPKCGSFFIDEEKKVAKVFYGFSHGVESRHMVNIIGEDGYFRKLDLGVEEDWCWGRAYSYVPSLVQIKQQGKQEEEISLLEKRRYDQNMLRLVEIDKRMKQEKGWSNFSIFYIA